MSERHSGEENFHELKQNTEKNLEISFEQEVEDYFAAEKRKKTWLSRLREDIKTRSLVLASVLGLHAAPLVIFDPEVRESFVEGVKEMIAAVKYGQAGDSQLAETSRLLQQDIKDFQSGQTEGKEAEEVLEKLIHLHLQVLEIRGGISEQEKMQTKQYLLDTIAKYRELGTKNIIEHGDVSEVDRKSSELFELSKDTGRYNAEKAKLSDIAVKGLGNCDSKALFRRIVLPAIYPGNELKFQFFGSGPNLPPHVRMIMKIDGDWYALEDGPPKKLLPDDFIGTQITDIDVYEKALVDETISSKKPVKDSGASPLKSSFSSTNTLYHIQFDHPPTRSSPPGFSTREETVTEYQTRQRLQYTQGGTIIDPQNLPPLQLYIGDTLHDVAQQMGGGEKKETDSDETKLTERQVADAMIEGRINLSAKKPVDLSPLYGVDLQSININNPGFLSAEIIQTYRKEIHDHFPNIKKIQVSIDQKGIPLFAELPHIENVVLTIASDIKNLDFLAGHSSLKNLAIHAHGSIDFSSLASQELEGFYLFNRAKREVSQNFEVLRKEKLKEVFLFDFEQLDSRTQHFLSTLPSVESISLTLDGNSEDKMVAFKEIDGFTSRSIRHFYFTTNYQLGSVPFDFDLEKLKGQPLQGLTVTGGSAHNLEVLHGMPLKTLTLQVNCEKSDIAAVKNISGLEKLEIICEDGADAETFANLNAFIQALPIEEKSVNKVSDYIDGRSPQESFAP